MYSMGERVHHLWPNVINIFEGKGTPFESTCTGGEMVLYGRINVVIKDTVFESL